MPNKGNLTVDLGNKELKLNNNNMLEKVCISMVDPTTGKTVKGYFIPEIKAKENKAVGQALDYLENKYPNMKDVISKVREGVDKPDNQQENKSGNKPANKPANQQVNQPVNQSADQPVNQNVNATESTQETSSVLYTEDEDTKSEEKNATATNVQGQNNSGAGTETEVDIDAIDSFWSSSWKKLLLFFGIGEKTVEEWEKRPEYKGMMKDLWDKMNSESEVLNEIIEGKNNENNPKEITVVVNGQKMKGVFIEDVPEVDKEGNEIEFIEGTVIEEKADEVENEALNNNTISDVETKPEEKQSEEKPEEKVEEKAEEKQNEEKLEEKAEEKQNEEKPEEKAEEKQNEEKAEEKKGEVKPEEKQNEVKPEEKKGEEKQDEVNSVEEEKKHIRVEKPKNGYARSMFAPTKRVKVDYRNPITKKVEKRDADVIDLRDGGLTVEILLDGNQDKLEEFWNKNSATLNDQEKLYMQGRMYAIQEVKETAEKEKRKLANDKKTPLPEIDETNNMVGFSGLKLSEPQTSGNGCWSCAYSLMFKSRGVDLSQETIRAWHPDFSKKEGLLDGLKNNDDILMSSLHRLNRDSANNIANDVDLLNQVLPNTNLNSITISPLTNTPLTLKKENVVKDKNNKDKTEITYKEADYAELNIIKDEYKKQVKNILVKNINDALKNDRSPVAISLDGHYVTVTGISKDGETVRCEDSLKSNPKDRTRTIKVDNLVNDALEIHTDFMGRMVTPKGIELTWLKDIKVPEYENREADKPDIDISGKGLIKVSGDGKINATLPLAEMEFSNIDNAKLGQLESKGVSSFVILDQTNIEKQLGMKVVGLGADGAFTMGNKDVYYPEKLIYKNAPELQKYKYKEDEKDIAAAKDDGWVLFDDDDIKEAKAAAKPEVKEEAKPEVKEEAKPEVKEEAKSEVKEEAKPEVKEEAKPEVKEEEKPEVKEEAKPEVKEEVKSEVKEEAKQPEVKAEEKAEEKKSSEADNQKDAEYELIAKNSVRIKKHAEVFIKALNNAVPGQKDDDFNSAYTVIDNARKGKVETAQEIKESVETVKQYVTGKMKVSSGKEKKRFDCCMRFLEDAMPRKEFETLCDDINKARGVENNRKDPNYVYPEQYINTITTAGRMLRRVTQRVKDGIGTERDIAFVAALRDFSADFKDEFEDAIYMTREERRANADKYDYSLNEVTKDNFRDLGEYTELIQKSKGFKEFMKYADKEVIDRIMNDEDGQMVDLIHFVNKAPIEHMEELIGRYKEGNSNAEIVIDDFIKEENEKKINAAKQDGWVIYGDVQQENELKEKLKEEHRKFADKIKAEWDVISPEEVEAIKAEEKAKILENWEDISREEADAIKAEEKKAKETATKKISEGWEEISPEEVAAIKAEEKADILEKWEDITKEAADAIKAGERTEREEIAKAAEKAAEEKKAQEAAAKETAAKKISEGWEEISPEEVAAIKAEEKAERDKAAKKKSADVNKDEKRRKLSKNELGELFGNIKESAIKRKNTMPSKRAAHKDEKAAVDDGNQIKKKNTFSKK